ncbi:energy-coupling factor transporter ATPase [Alkalibaculum sp. M08DMB]|uniref:Energy-coupling factor transporter ATPase n=1 Tax=Alkalibaculum sporogenes TaxID=2655001 RepID=A0A6A7K6E6_9FIRM|nr:energy-coupling factor transporter ATPase [Alkalibaculum sporogenes]
MVNDVISIEEVSYYYNNNNEKNTALDKVSLHIKHGEFIAIIGHNGSGKSTLSKLINGILIPTDGNIRVMGLNTKDEDAIWDIRQQAGMVFQNPDNQLVATIVEEDVAFGPENLGIPSKEIRKRVDWALDVVEMREYKDQKPHQLSGGQKQRIAIAGILAMKPKCIILDEPTAMLDPSGRREVMNTIKRLNKDEMMTIVHITHYMDEIIDADRVIVMEKGKIVMEGTPREIFSQIEELKKLRLDVPQITELAYELNKEGIPMERDVLSVEEMVMKLCQ